MFNVFNALGQNGHHVVHHVVEDNKHVIKSVSEEQKVKDWLIQIIMNHLRTVFMQSIHGGSRFLNSFKLEP